MAVSHRLYKGSTLRLQLSFYQRFIQLSSDMRLVAALNSSSVPSLNTSMTACHTTQYVRLHLAASVEAAAFLGRPSLFDLMVIIVELMEHLSPAAIVIFFVGITFIKSFTDPIMPRLPPRTPFSRHRVPPLYGATHNHSQIKGQRAPNSDKGGQTTQKLTLLRED